MLTPLESGLFDTIAGLPMHPLVVHFAVVLLPLAALGLILLVIVPAWADRFGWLTLAGLAGGTAAAFAAKESGESLARDVGTPVTHAAWGDQLPVLAVGLVILAGAWYFLHRRGGGAAQPRTPATAIVGGLAAVLALVVTGATVVVGHTGAQAAWGAVTDSAGDRPTAPASPAPSPTSKHASPSPATSGSASPSPSASPSEAAAGYTMAQVAQHSDASSCWTAINGNAYDLTDWINQHPGGQRAILGMCGRDATAAFEGQHGGQRQPERELKQFLLGPIG